jgi:hypothetical protein
MLADLCAPHSRTKKVQKSHNAGIDAGKPTKMAGSLVQQVFVQFASSR